MHERTNHRGTARRRTALGTALAAALVGAAAMGPAAAAPAAFDVPLTGTSSFGGDEAELPEGSRLAGTLDTATGGVAADATFPETTTTETFEAAPGFSVTVTLVSQVVQIEPLDASIDPGTRGAAGTMALALDVKRASVNDGEPMDLEPCRFGPFDLDLTGDQSADGTLRLADPAVTVPPTEDDCGGFADQINDEVAGSEGAIELVAAGLPPAAGPEGAADGTTAGAAPADPAPGEPAGAGAPSPAPEPSPVPLADTGADLVLLLTAGAAAAGVGLLARRTVARR